MSIEGVTKRATTSVLLISASRVRLKPELLPFVCSGMIMHAMGWPLAPGQTQGKIWICLEQVCVMDSLSRTTFAGRVPWARWRTLAVPGRERRPRHVQARTLQRRFRDWRARHGVEPEVFFEQVAVPGREAAIDFTHATDLGVTIAGAALPHLLFEFVLSYSHWTWVTIARDRDPRPIRGLLSTRTGR
jgi:hypothetical protein